MLRLSKLTDYGIVVSACLARAATDLLSASEVAARTGIAAPTVSKLLKGLGRAGLVISERGAKGGYRLSRAAGDISIADVVDALEGPVALTECISAVGHCEQESHCDARANFELINAAILDALERVSVAEMVHGPQHQYVHLDVTGMVSPREDSMNESV
ncbi:MAG: SUF system Fe-S cluster assembly regulator [Gammaproteobacteria bacterium]|nr:SUF system Fe-S cluster assembly regulator [Gammaproteobacteria bacterium]